MSDTESMSIENSNEVGHFTEVDQQAIQDLEEEFDNLPSFGGDVVLQFQQGDELYPYHEMDNN